MNIVGPVIEGEVVEEYDPHPVVGATILTRMHRTLDELPEGSILQTGEDDNWNALAYRATTFEWMVTGWERPVTSDKLFRFASAWTVVRIGGSLA